MTLIPARNSEGTIVISVGAIFATLAIVAFGLRIWAHRIQKAALDSSDYCCAIGLIFALALLGITVDITIQGLGLDVTEVSPEHLVNFSKGLIAGTFMWIISNTFIRIAILLLYIQLFRIPKFRSVCYGVIGLNLLFVIIVILVSSLICRPFALQWDPTLNGHCGNVRSFYLFLPIFNLFLDVVIVSMPIPILWGLQMVRSKKIALCVIFGMGFGICIITMFRIIETARADLHNPTIGDSKLGVLGLLEPFLGVIDSCIPFLRPIAQKVTKSDWFAEIKQSTIRSRALGNGKNLHTYGSDRTKRFQPLNDSSDLGGGSIRMTTRIDVASGENERRDRAGELDGSSRYFERV